MSRPDDPSPIPGLSEWKNTSGGRRSRLGLAIAAVAMIGLPAAAFRLPRPAVAAMPTEGANFHVIVRRIDPSLMAWIKARAGAGAKVTVVVPDPSALEGSPVRRMAVGEDRIRSEGILVDGTAWHPLPREEKK